MQNIELILKEITVNPVTLAGNSERVFHKGNTFEIKAGRNIKQGNLEISATITIEDPDKKITNIVQFIEWLRIVFKEPQAVRGNIIQG